MSYFNYSSTLFSGMSTGSTSSFTSLLGEYNQIRNGTYGRLLKAYYKKYNADGTAKDTTDTTKNTTQKVKTSSDTLDTAKELDTVADTATSLQTAATKLAAVKEGSSSLYAKKTIVDTNEDGTTSTRTDYDYDTLVNSVKSFVSAYNETLESVGSIESSSVQQKTQWLTQVTSQYKDELAGVGITVDKDGRLALDEETFRGTEMTELQDFFEGTDSVVGKLARKASSLAGAAELQATKAASAYTATGDSYAADSMNSGTLFDSLF
ncbi:MAG: hypothetical protein IJW37_03540 [Lachnospiraceae bacterium]|nr:hypothetical protein [Lachnospiraceae bacterium]